MVLPDYDDSLSLDDEQGVVRLMNEPEEEINTGSSQEEDSAGGDEDYLESAALSPIAQGFEVEPEFPTMLDTDDSENPLEVPLTETKDEQARRRFERRLRRAENEKRRKRFSFLMYICCIIILVPVVFLLIDWIFHMCWTGWFHDCDNGGGAGDNYQEEPLPDEFWEVTNPFGNVVTTKMDPYSTTTCFYEDQTYPNIAQQCECWGTISDIPDDVRELYPVVREEISQALYNGLLANEGIESCSPQNQAILWLSSGDNRAGGDFRQRHVLAVAYYGLNGTKWDDTNLWLTEQNECLWWGLECNRRFELDQFDLEENNLMGSLPSELLNFRALQSFNVPNQHLTGQVPRELFYMPRLKSMTMQKNKLHGSIPTDIGRMTTLKNLRIENNIFWGTIPSQLGKLTLLENLILGFNQFWRTIPTELGNLSKLENLVLEDNRLSGTLPTEFASMTDLVHFHASYNLLSGATIPTEYVNMTSLIDWRFSDTGVGGTIPSELGLMTSLLRLDMSRNKLVSTLPSELGALTLLNFFAFSSNDITGFLPTEYGRMNNMTRFLANDNLLEGTLPTEYGLMTRLAEIDISKNAIQGTVPSEVCALRLVEMHLLIADCAKDEFIHCPTDGCCVCRKHA